MKRRGTRLYEFINLFSLYGVADKLFIITNRAENCNNFQVRASPITHTSDNLRWGFSLNPLFILHMDFISIESFHCLPYSVGLVTSVIKAIIKKSS